jgi:hypothetical protein
MHLHLVSRVDAKRAGLKRFFLGTPCGNGHYSERLTSNMVCCRCSTEYHPKYQRENPAKWIKYRADNRERLAREAREYRAENREVIAQKDVARKRKKRAEDPRYALIHRIRALVSMSLSGGGFSKKSKTARILGCSWDEFQIHIERQFLPGMSWDNRSKWHIDHIRPMAGATTEAEAIALNHFTNLRPLWAKKNLEKGAKATFLI